MLICAYVLLNRCLSYLFYKFVNSIDGFYHRGVGKKNEKVNCDMF